MSYYKITALACVIAASSLALTASQKAKNLPKVALVMGSTRDSRLAEPLAQAVLELLDKNKVVAEIIDLKSFVLPFVDPEVDQEDSSEIDRFAQKISQLDGVIFLVPNYNKGYPGVLQNALDATDAWRDKVAAVIGYSGGPNGLNHAQTIIPVIKALGMKPLPTIVPIKFIYGAFNPTGGFKKDSVKKDIEAQLQELYQALDKKA